LQSRGLDPQVDRGFLQRGQADSSKVRQDMMIVEMTASEQQMYLPFDDTTEATLPTPPALMQNGKARRIWMVEGGYCSDTIQRQTERERRPTSDAADSIGRPWVSSIDISSHSGSFRITFPHHNTSFQTARAKS